MSSIKKRKNVGWKTSNNVLTSNFAAPYGGNLKATFLEGVIFTPKIMVYLNFTNLDDETQQYLLSVSKKDVERKFGDDLKAYAKQHHLNYDMLLDEEATRNLYNYNYVFNI